MSLTQAIIVTLLWIGILWLGLDVVRYARRIPSKRDLRLIDVLNDGARPMTGREVARAYRLKFDENIGYGTIYVSFRYLQEWGLIASIVDLDPEDGCKRIRFTSRA